MLCQHNGAFIGFEWVQIIIFAKLLAIIIGASVIGVSSSQVDLVIVCSASCCIVVHNDGNCNVVDVVIHEHCVLTMLLNSDLSHEVRLEVNLAKKEKKRKLREWEVNEIFEDNQATKLPLGRSYGWYWKMHMVKCQVCAQIEGR